MTGGQDTPANTPDKGGLQHPHPRSRSRGERVRPDGGTNSGRERHRILRELRSELLPHPAVQSVEGEPSDEYPELRAVLDPSWFGRDTETASLRVTWTPGPIPGHETSGQNDPWRRTPIRAYYTLHYSEPDGLDCGFHCEPNPHVDGLLHYQQREDSNDAYTYEPVSFGAGSTTGLLWEMMDALADRLRNL